MVGNVLKGPIVPTILRLTGISKTFGAVRALKGVSFELEGVHAHDVSEILDRHAVAVRAGHHCAQVLMDRLGVSATTRASLAVYNTRHEIDRLIDALHDVRRVFELD